MNRSRIAKDAIEGAAQQRLAMTRCTAGSERMCQETPNRLGGVPLRWCWPTIP